VQRSATEYRDIQKAQQLTGQVQPAVIWRYLLNKFEDYDRVVDDQRRDPSLGPVASAVEFVEQPQDKQVLARPLKPINYPTYSAIVNEA
jgi:hypothetical protein